MSATEYSPHACQLTFDESTSCRYTLTEDTQTWVFAPKKGRDYLDYCTRHEQIEKRLKLCKDGTTTSDGDEVKEL